jgi:hypothetical protein
VCIIETANWQRAHIVAFVRLPVDCSPERMCSEVWRTCRADRRSLRPPLHYHTIAVWRCLCQGDVWPTHTPSTFVTCALHGHHCLKSIIVASVHANVTSYIFACLQHVLVTPSHSSHAHYSLWAMCCYWWCPHVHRHCRASARCTYLPSCSSTWSLCSLHRRAVVRYMLYRSAFCNCQYYYEII